jgi:hypothetical protein
MKKLILVSIFFLGCSPEEVQRVIEQVFIHDTIRVTLPADNFFSPIVLDQGGFGENENVQVKVDTVWKDKIKTVYVRGKERIIKVPYNDTIYVDKVVIKKEENSFMEDLKVIFYMALGISVIGFVLNIFRR